jgi:uncharacterized repeat protein (TIGR03803 family)
LNQPFGFRHRLSRRNPGWPLLFGICAWLCASSSAGQAYSVVYSFSARSGLPLAGLTHTADGRVLGVTTFGGIYGRGSVFELTPNGAGGYSYAELDVASPANLISGLHEGLFEASDGNLYTGSYYHGDGHYEGGGAIVRVDSAGQLSVAHVFEAGGPSGFYPTKPVQAADGNLYGSTLGGLFGRGTLYRMDLAENLTTIHQFSGLDGAVPTALVAGDDGFLYGATSEGGAHNAGTIFRASLAGDVTTLHSFDVSGGMWPGPLVQADDGTLYGTTYAGGLSGGTIFRIEPSGTLTTLRVLAPDADGGAPSAALLPGSDGKLYGTASKGGAAGGGTLFRVDTDGSDFTKLHDFSVADGSSPLGALIEIDGALLGTTWVGGPGLNGTVFMVDSAGAYSVIHAFAGEPEGQAPMAGLRAGSDGYLYGTTIAGGAGGQGAIFRLDMSGNLETVYAFGPGDGTLTTSRLTEIDEGVFAGTSSRGGAYGFGAVFRVTSEGTGDVLHSFSGGDQNGRAGLTLGSDGHLYGSTEFDGSNGQGTLFRLDLSGSYTTLYDFDGTQGAQPAASLLRASDGRLFGVASGGGEYGSGTIFRMEENGAATSIHSFSGFGLTALPGLMEASDGYFYGTNPYDVYRATQEGEVQTIHGFEFSDGYWISDALVEGPDGRLYGSAATGGPLGEGTVFRVDPDGDFAVLHLYGQLSEGSPYGGLEVGADGRLYGTAEHRGERGGGVIFRIDPAEAISISSIEPQAGPAAGGTLVTLQGVGFEPGVRLAIGGWPIAPISASATEITAIAPALEAGAVHTVQVTNPDESFHRVVRGWLTDPVDVPVSSPFADAVRRLLSSGISFGCGGGAFCPHAPWTRAHAAVHLLRARLGPGYAPPPATGLVFADVGADAFGAAWIEDLAARGITAGCGGGSFCPASPVSRAGAAILLLKTLLGSDYVPEAGDGAVFADVPAGSFGAAWIEDLASRGIAAGCSLAPPMYCPDAGTTRAQAAAWIVEAFFP